MTNAERQRAYRARKRNATPVTQDRNVTVGPLQLARRRIDELEVEVAFLKEQLAARGRAATGVTVAKAVPDHPRPKAGDPLVHGLRCQCVGCRATRR